MCGRYATTRSAADLAALFEAVDVTGGEVSARYNVAPTDPVPLVRMARESGEHAGGYRRTLDVGCWGLLPHWARDRRAASRMINARSETVATSPAYAAAFASRRALVPADGWYEWRRVEGRRQAYFMTPADGTVLALAGVWSRWGESGLLTFSVITTAAVGALAQVHDRMPLILDPTDWQDWLQAEPGAAAADLLQRPATRLLPGLEIRPVGPAIGNVRNDGPELVMRVDVMPAADQLW